MEAMGSHERSPATALIDRLVRAPQRFNLFQAISLIERHVAPGRTSTVGAGDGDGDSVRIVGHISLAFQPSDICSVSLATRADNARSRYAPRYILSTPVMSLAGGQGPLPVPFTEMILEREAVHDHATRDFLDIFNHRFLSFLFRSRQKHTPSLNWGGMQTSPQASCIRAIANFAPPCAQADRLSWLQHAGLMNAAPRSISGLLTLLANRLGIDVRGEQFVGDWYPLDAADAVRLSHTTGYLGNGRALGERVWNQSAGIRLDCRMLTLDRLRALLPCGDAHPLLLWLVRRYLQAPLNVHLVLRLAPCTGVENRLGRAASMRLGWTSWITGTSGTTDKSAPLPPVILMLGADGATASPAACIDRCD